MKTPIWILLLFLLTYQSSQAMDLQDTVRLSCLPAVACDSPLVTVVVRVQEPIQDLGRFRVTLRYYNPTFYYNGNLFLNPDIDNLLVTYYPGGATDILIVERTDTTAISLTEPWLFKFEANYFGGQNMLNFDTMVFSPDACYFKDAAGQDYPVAAVEGWVYSPQASCSIQPTVPVLSDTTLVPVMLGDMPPLENFAFKIHYSVVGLEFLGIENLNAALAPFANFTFSESNGEISIAWHSGMPLAMIGNGKLFDLKFNVLQHFPGIIPLTFDVMSAPFFLGPDTAAQAFIPTCFVDGFVSIQFAIDENKPGLQQVVISPNPSSDGVYTVNIPSGFPVTEWKLCDLQGKLLASGTFMAGQTSSKLDLGFLPKGVYLLRLGAKDQVCFRKVVRE